MIDQVTIAGDVYLARAAVFAERQAAELRMSAAAGAGELAGAWDAIAKHARRRGEVDLVEVRRLCGETDRVLAKERAA